MWPFNRKGKEPSTSSEKGKEPGYDIEPVVVCAGPNGLDKVVLTNYKGCTVEILLYGGQIIAWKNEYGEDYLFMSKKAAFTPPKPIRGGIPICFPQFGTYGHLETNGFAKHMTWTIEENPPKILQKYPSPKTKSFVDLLLLPSQNTNRIYPYTWELRLRVILGQNGNLTLIPRVRNMNLEKRDMAFTFALQAHFHISDVGEVRLEGLETMDYYDHLNNKTRATEYGDALTFEKEVDKAYLETPGKIAIIDHAKRRTYVVLKEGLPDCVLWNPWDKQAKKIPDFGDKEFRNMLCLQPAIIERPLKLKPGQEWTGRVQFTIVNSSYFSGPLEPHRALNPTRSSLNSS
ncbi:hypothetical protein LUZ63_011643 [Rhynchospora breviuscula]|uniref:glucose-6-phosphate 1-epimerase n=1 Tax=Rhynchospora breviuscula TaxID=2022672 RepID=A0A9Q0CJA8_9POAL|nr:hypothetical protein LUZ63_011643 [Rhynchospora breviuscula]